MAVEGVGDEGGYIQSQSLIHQVSVSDFENARIRNDFVKPCLNPLFIRSQFQIEQYGLFPEEKILRLNPLFIRSQFQMSM